MSSPHHAFQSTPDNRDTSKIKASSTCQADHITRNRPLVRQSVFFFPLLIVLWDVAQGSRLVAICVCKCNKVSHLPLLPKLLSLLTRGTESFLGFNDIKWAGDRLPNPPSKKAQALATVLGLSKYKWDHKVYKAACFFASACLIRAEVLSYAWSGSGNLILNEWNETVFFNSGLYVL